MANYKAEYLHEHGIKPWYVFRDLRTSAALYIWRYGLLMRVGRRSMGIFTSGSAFTGTGIMLFDDNMVRNTSFHCPKWHQISKSVLPRATGEELSNPKNYGRTSDTHR